MTNSLQHIIDHSKAIVFFTGAGVSCASGIPDFRSSTGLYQQNFTAESILSHSYFMQYPNEFYQFYRTHMIYPSAKPNNAHHFMAACEAKGIAIGVITQNIDGLHQMAGSKKVVELHGSIHRNHCMHCHTFYPLTSITESDGIPYCPKCRGIIKPDVTLYQESLDNHAINECIQLIQQADTLIISGTSLSVYPAASFIRYFQGNNLVLINRQATSADNYADLVLHQDLNTVFNQITL